MSQTPKVVSRSEEARRPPRTYNLAFIYFKNNEFVQAEKAARDYITSNSKCDKGHRLLGDILYTQNKRDDALAAYQKSLEINPNQEEVLSNVCDLITPDSSNIERLEFWAERAAKAGFLDVAEKFRRNIDAAKSSSFPDNRKLNNVLTNIVRHDKTSKSLDKTPMSMNGSSERSTPSRMAHENDLSFGGVTTRSLPTPEKLLLQKQQESLLKNLSVHQEHIMKNLDDQQSKITQSTSGLLTSIKENRELILSVKATVDTIMKEFITIRASIKELKEGQTRNADATAKLTEAFNNFNLTYDGGVEDYDDENYETYEDDGSYQPGVAGSIPLQIRNIPDLSHLQNSSSDIFVKTTTSQPMTVSIIPPTTTSSVFSRLGTATATQPTPASTRQSTTPVLSSLLTSSTQFTVPTSSASATVKPFSFGLSSSQTTQPFTATVAKPFSFGLPNTSSTTPQTSTSSGFDGGISFGTPQQSFQFGQSSFNFTFGQNIPFGNNNQDSKRDDDEEDEGDASDPEAEQEVHFEPVIALPPKVDVVLGEEDEEELFKERCKVYRFTDKEWKERGTGFIKVLYNPKNQKSRLLMRREQVLKVCVNHFLTADVEFKPFGNPPHTRFTWSANNASDGDPVPEILCVKFKTEQEATRFLDAIQDAKSKHLNSSTTSADDVEVVYVKETDKELTEKAEKLKLPSNFYDYMKKDPCPGCKGCENDSPDNSETVNVASLSVAALTTSISSVTTTTTSTSSTTSSPSASATTKSTNSPLAPSKFGGSSTTSSSTTSVFGSTPVFGGGPTTGQSTFSFGLPSSTSTTPASSTTTTTTPSSVFGSFTFGSPASVFGNTNNATTTSSTTSASIISSPQNSTGFNWGTLKTVFGNQTLTNGIGEKKETATFGFKFGNQDEETKSTGFSWGNDSNSTAPWMNAKPAPIFGEKATDDKDEDDDNEGDENDEEHDPQFAPIIPLPEEVEIKTGEEDEDVVYCQRGKLYRFDAESKQWKERGIGDLKILKHKEKTRYRIVMRREQVHKIACNHYITKEVNSKNFPNSETTVSWTAMDYSEESPELQGFAAKFKTVELLNCFVSKFNEFQLQLP